MCDDPVNRAVIYQANASKDGILIYNIGFITVRNFTVTGQGASATLKFGATAQSYNGGQFTGVTFSNLTVSGFHDGIVVEGYGTTADGFKSVLIQSCQASNNLHSGGHTYALAVGAISNVVVQGCTFNNNAGDPTATGNTGSGFEFAETVDGVIDHCVAHDNGGAGTASAGPVGLWAYDSKRITIQYCESYRNQAQNQDGDGFDLDLNTSDSMIEYCYSHDNYGAGYLLGSDALSGHVWSNNVVRYCISENDGTGGSMGALQIFCPAGPTAIQNSQLYGNTIYSRLRPAIAFNINNSGISGVYLRNNLFVTTNNNILVSLVSPSPAPTAAQACFQGNDYWPSGGAFQVQIGPSSYATSLGAWRAAVPGQERVSGTDVGFNLDPRLTRPGGGGTIGNAYALTNLIAYQLQPGSPLINTGLNLTNSPYNLNPGTNDFYGTLIPQQGAYDIGAAEFTPLLTTTTLTNSVNPSTYGGNVTFTAWVKTNGTTVATATSNYVFKVDGVPLATNAVSSGSVSVSTSGLTAGTHSISAEYRGDASYGPSTNSVNQYVNKQTPILTAPSAATITYGQRLIDSNLTGGAATNTSNNASVTGTFAFTTPSLAPSAGTTNVGVTFTPSDTNYNSAVTTVSVAVAQNTPVLTPPSASAIIYGQLLSASILTGGTATNGFNQASVSGSFAFTIPSLTPGVGTTNVSVIFTPSDTTNYNANTTLVSVLVQGGQTVSIAGAMKLADGSFQLTFTGEQGQPFRVLGTNLPGAPLGTWPALMSGLFGIGGPVTTNFSDTGVTLTQDQRFYRIASP
jgi:hypothetical protein